MTLNALHIDGIDVPDAIATLAQTLHDRRGVDLVVQFPVMPQVATSNALWHADGLTLAFTSLAARNQCVAALAVHELISQVAMPTPDELFKRAYQLCRNEIGHPDNACGRFLALWHEHANIFQAAASLINHGSGNVFDILRPLGMAMVFLPDFTVDDLLEITHAHYAKTSNDLAGGIFSQTIEQALTSRPKQAWELYERVRNDESDSAGSLYLVALLALTKGGQQSQVIDKALADIQGGSTNSLKRGLWLLGILLASVSLSSDLLKTSVTTLRQYLHNPEVDIHLAAVRAIGHAASQQLQLLPDLLALATACDQTALRCVLNLLYLDDGSIKASDCFTELVRTLSNLELQAGFAISDFDQVLAQLFADPHTVELAESCLTAWMLKNSTGGPVAANLADHFSATVSEMVKHRDLLARIITNWLLSDENQLAVVCAGLISLLWVRDFRQPIFSKSVLDGLNAADLMFLARRMLGYVWHEEAMLSLTFSLLDTEDAAQRTYDLVHALLVDEVGRDYGFATIKAIKLRKEIAPLGVLPLLDSAHHKLSAIASAREKLPRSDELRPPEKLRRAIALQRARESEKEMEKANQKSVFLNLVTRVQMKAGVGWFGVRDGVVSEPSMLHTISTQTTLPLRSVLDPVNDAISRLGFRSAKRGDQ